MESRSAPAFDLTHNLMRGHDEIFPDGRPLERSGAGRNIPQPRGIDVRGRRGKGKKRRNAARSQIWPAQTAAEPRLHADRGPRPRAGDRRQYRHLQPARRGGAAPAPLSAPRAPGADLGQLARAGADGGRGLGAQVPGPARQRRLRERHRLSRRGRQPERAGGPRSLSTASGSAGSSSTSGGSSRCWGAAFRPPRIRRGAAMW